MKKTNQYHLLVLFLILFLYSCNFFKPKELVLKDGIFNISLDENNNLFFCKRKNNLYEIIKMNIKNKHYDKIYDTNKEILFFEQGINHETFLGINELKNNKSEVYFNKDKINTLNKILEDSLINNLKISYFEQNNLFYLKARSVKKYSTLGNKTFHDYIFVKYNYKDNKMEFNEEFNKFLISGFTFLDQDNILFTSSNDILSKSSYTKTFFIFNQKTKEINYPKFIIENLPKVMDMDSFYNLFSFVNAEYSVNNQTLLAVSTNRYLCTIDLQTKKIKVIKEFDTNGAKNVIKKVIPFYNESKILVLQENGLTSIINYQGHLLDEFNLNDF